MKGLSMPRSRPSKLVLLPALLGCLSATGLGAQELSYNVPMRWHTQAPTSQTALGLFLYDSSPSSTCVRVLLELPSTGTVALLQHLDVAAGVEQLELRFPSGWWMRLERELPGKWPLLADFHASGQAAYERLAETEGSLRWSVSTSRGPLLERRIAASASDHLGERLASELRSSQAQAELRQELPAAAADFAPFFAVIGEQRSRLGGIFDPLFVLIRSVSESVPKETPWIYEESPPVPGSTPREPPHAELLERSDPLLVEHCRR
jgi:hypothetical protein